MAKYGISIDIRQGDDVPHGAILSGTGYVDWHETVASRATSDYARIPFGTLALVDGTYLIEPVRDDQMPRKPSSSKAHIVYKSRSHSFHKYDFSSSSTIIPSTPSLIITSTATSDNSSYSISNNDNNSTSDFQIQNHTAYRVSNDNADYDNNTAQYVTIFDPNINITGFCL
ncbi:unnamed protein product [Onchocerca flexuosa]|uniref:MIB/HERC2 domain-containing protein n=1 Tax=Onchocerca flexuosa TaxID=387005 RepID=A0A183I643_9BILA|nr:unnamed protein product [Onchocerca flexuosa]